MLVLDLQTGVERELQVGEKIGEGAQAEVFKVVGAGGTREVLKLYRVPPEHSNGQHLVALAEHVRNYPELAKREDVCIPSRVVQVLVDGRVGTILPRVRGEPLTQPACAALYQLGLSARLVAGKRFAENVAVFHGIGLVHCDLAEANTVAEISSGSIAVVDADGGGVLANQQANKYRAGLHPLVRGRMEGSLMSPEMVDDDACAPSLWTDRWCLGVMEHMILLGGLDPFFFLLVYDDLRQGRVEWPPRRELMTAQSKQMLGQFQRHELARLGPRIGGFFTAIFNRAADGQWGRRLRPAAKEWVDALEVANRWIMRCRVCKEEFVATGVRQCPFCRAEVPHAQVFTTNYARRLDREGANLIGRDLGFRDRDGRYSVVAFGRQQDRVLMWPQLPVRDLVSGRDLPRTPSEPIKLNPGRHGFRAWSEDGMSHAEFRVTVAS